MAAIAFSAGMAVVDAGGQAAPETSSVQVSRIARLVVNRFICFMQKSSFRMSKNIPSFKKNAFPKTHRYGSGSYMEFIMKAPGLSIDSADSSESMDQNKKD